MPFKTNLRALLLAVLAGVAVIYPSEGTAQEQAATEAKTGSELQEKNASLPKEIIPQDYLILPRVGNYRRGALHQDPIESQLARSDWEMPKSGDKVLSSVGVETGWREESSQTGERIYAGGYAATSFQSKSSRTMLMDSSGCAAVWLNGQWYVGNPYGLPNHVIVVPIKEGENRLVVHLASPKARPKFYTPEADLSISSALVPDAVILSDSEESKSILTGPGSIRITNTSDQAIEDALLVVKAEGFEPIKTRVKSIAGLSTIDAPIKLPEGRLESVDELKTLSIQIEVHNQPNEKQKEDEQNGSAKEYVLATYTAELKIVTPNELRIETFLSKIDKSVQKYAYLPPKNASDLETPPALAVVLHDAGEEFVELLEKSEPLDDIAQIAPFGRGLYGFDWEDWSAQDALEALADLTTKSPYDTERVALVGRGMGGHGALWLGSTNPSRFFAVSVSDGWLNLLLPSDDLPRDVMLKNLTSMLDRRSNAADLFELSVNLRNTPVRLYQTPKHKGTARAEMLELRSILGGFHPNFAYREVELSLADQIKEAVKSASENRDHRRSLDPNTVKFRSPGLDVLAEMCWAKVNIPIASGKPLQLHLKRDKKATLFEGTTDNIRRLTLSLKGMKRTKQVKIQLDGQTPVRIAWPSRSSEITIERNEEGEWGTPQPPEVALLKNLEKSAVRPGGLKSVFQNNPVLVYGTQGSDDENRWAKAKANYDADMFRYRGSGRLEVVADRDFRNDDYLNRNLICYGNFQTNRAARTIFRITQVNALNKQIRIGERPEIGDDLSILLVGPRIGSKTASVAMIGGTGIVGMRNTTRLRYFWSGVHYPDLFVFGPKAISTPKDATPLEDVRAVGYRGIYWEVKKGEIAWRDLAL